MHGPDVDRYVFQSCQRLDADADISLPLGRSNGRHLSLQALDDISELDINVERVACDREADEVAEVVECESG